MMVWQMAAKLTVSQEIGLSVMLLSWMNMHSARLCAMSLSIIEVGFGIGSGVNVTHCLSSWWGIVAGRHWKGTFATCIAMAWQVPWHFGLERLG